MGHLLAGSQPQIPLDAVTPSSQIDTLLEEVDADRSGIFWG